MKKIVNRYTFNDWCIWNDFNSLVQNNQILKVNYSLKKDTKFKFKYAIFGDLFLQAATHFTIAASDNMDIVDQDEPL